MRLHRPRAVPVGIVAPAVLVAERVTLRAARVGEKAERVSPILERIDDHAKAVAAAAAKIALQLVGDQAIGLGIVEDGADIQRGAVIEKADDGPPRRELELSRLLLIEIGDRLRPFPRWLVEHTIDPDRLVDAERARLFRRADRLEVGLRLGNGRVETDHARGQGEASHPGTGDSGLGIRDSGVAPWHPLIPNP